MTKTLKTHRDLVQLFDTYNETLYTFVFFRVYKQKEVAEDITQDVFIQAWENRHSFDGKKASIKTWLYTIARNKCIDHLRKESRQVSAPDALFNIQVTPQTDEQKINYAITLQQALEKLPSDQQELIVLRYVQDISIQEIATIIHKSYTATKTAIHRAYKALQVYLD